MNKYALRIACAAALGLGAFTVKSLAAPVVNGSYDADYGSAAAVQQVPTGFGDNNLGQTGFANGSELDAGYGVVSGGRLYLFLAGNLETNFNKLDVFIHTGLGGMNQISNIPNNQGNFNNMSGMTFDAGFQAAYWISMTAGGATPDIFVDSANLITLAGNYSGQTTPTNGTLVGGNGGAVIEATAEPAARSRPAGAKTAPSTSKWISTLALLSMLMGSPRTDRSQPSAVVSCKQDRREGAWAGSFPPPSVRRSTRRCPPSR
jgi:hypothetical protein